MLRLTVVDNLGNPTLYKTASVGEAPWSSGERQGLTDWAMPWTWVRFTSLPKNFMDKTDHLMAEKNENNENSQKGQVTPKKY